MNYDKTTPHSSFEECVNQELQGEWLPAYGCLAPWMSSTNRCNTTLKFKPEHEALTDEANGFYVNALYGYDNVNSNCLPPCVQTSVDARYFETHDRPYWNYSRIAISFGPKVEKFIMKSSYTEVDLLIEAGSSLGLWLGLSVIGLYDLFIIAVSKLMLLLFEHMPNRSTFIALGGLVLKKKNETLHFI